MKHLNQLKRPTTSEKLKGNTNCKGHKNHLGHKHTEQTKQLIGIAAKSWTRSPEQIQAMKIGRKKQLANLPTSARSRNSAKMVAVKILRNTNFELYSDITEFLEASTKRIGNENINGHNAVIKSAIDYYTLGYDRDIWIEHVIYQLDNRSDTVDLNVEIYLEEIWSHVVQHCEQIMLVNATHKSIGQHLLGHYKNVFDHIPTLDEMISR